MNALELHIGGSITKLVIWKQLSIQGSPIDKIHIYSLRQMMSNPGWKVN